MRNGRLIRDGLFPCEQVRTTDVCGYARGIERWQVISEGRRDEMDGWMDGHRTDDEGERTVRSHGMGFCSYGAGGDWQLFQLGRSGNMYRKRELPMPVAWDW